jgi:hypothetical protein
VSVSPSDAAVAARTFPRRWRALFARAAGEGDAPDVLDRSGAPELALRAARLLGDAAEQLHGRPPAPIDDPLEALEGEAVRLADAIDAVDPGLWDRERTADLSAAIEGSAALLREAERAVDAATARATRDG